MRSSRAGWSRRWLAAISTAVLLVVPAVTTAFAATPKPPTISVDPTRGPAGLPIAISGTGYAAGTTYGMCVLPAGKTKCGYEGANLVGGAPAEQFTAASDGTIPSGTTGIVPDLPAGDYHVVSTAPGTGFIVASSPFSVTAPTFALDPSSGPGGSDVVVKVAGAAPSTKYTVCLYTVDSPGCGGTALPLGDISTDASGGFPAGTTILLPGEVPDTYRIGIYLTGANNTWLASATFAETAPTFTLGTSSGPAGTVVTVSGSGYAPGKPYVVCLFAQSDAPSCGAGINLVTFTADSSGSVPAGVSVTVPQTKVGDARIGVMVASNTPWYLASAGFAVQAGTAVPASPTVAPTSPASPAAATATATAATNASAPSATPTGSESASGGGLPVFLIAILLIVVLLVAFAYARSRRGRTPA